MAISLNANSVIDGRYRLDARIGAGSFGQVWRATRVVEGQEFGRTCAIKVIQLLESASGSSGSGRKLTPRWLEEPRALAKVEAGGAIPQIFEANVWDTCAYIAMELLEGEDLAKRVAAGPIPWRRALVIAEQIAIALAAAHKLEIIHRDLKPSNVILAGPRRVCVIDWGIAQLGSVISEAPASVPQRTAVTLEGTYEGPISAGVAPVSAAPTGTPGYMAPEAYERAAPSPANDAFALGVVLYEMLTGRLPHALQGDPPRSGASTEEIRAYRMQIDKATQELDQVPFVSVKERCPGLPPGVVSLVEELLARDPRKRPTDRLVEAVAQVMRFPHGVPDPPYTGLVALGPGHAGLFFGQDATIDRVLEKLTTERAVLLWGPSGSGKSSLAAAGIAGRMDRTLFLDTDGWRIHVVRPSNAGRDRAEAEDPEARTSVVPAWGRLRVLDGAWQDVVAPWDAPALRAPGGRGLRPSSVIGDVVVIDQMEEVLDLPEPARTAFCDGLLALVNGTSPVAVGHTVCNPGGPVRVIATLRDDLEWKVDRDLPALRPLLERRVIAKGVDANFAEKIVAEPARAAGFKVEDLDLVRRHVEDKLSNNAATLPVIQFALSEWWARRDKERKTLPRAAWTEIGGVDGALSFVGERLFAGLDAHGKGRLERLMLRFFREGRKHALAEAELTDPTDQTIVESLVKLRLVRRRVDQGSSPVFEVEHESLAHHWQRLDQWITAARGDEELAADLDRRAGIWEKDGGRDEVVLSVDKLEYARRIEDRLTKSAVAYVRAGRDHVVRRRRDQIRRRVAIGVVAFAIVGTVVGGALLYARQAEKGRLALVASENMARANAKKATDNETTAKVKEAEALALKKEIDGALKDYKKKTDDTLARVDRDLEKIDRATTLAGARRAADEVRKTAAELRGAGGVAAASGSGKAVTTAPTARPGAATSIDPVPPWEQ